MAPAEPDRAPAPLHALALRFFRHLPRSVRLRLIRAVAPSHTVGALCLIESDGQLLLLRQRHREGWTLPGGLLARGETPAQAVVREVAEETGLRIAVDQPLTVVVDPQARRVDVLFHIPVADRPRVEAGSEALSAGWKRPSAAGEVDIATAQAFVALSRARRPGSHSGRLLPADPSPPQR